MNSPMKPPINHGSAACATCFTDWSLIPVF
jgi:hypothetical protein